MRVVLGWNKELVDDLVCAAMRVNYGQDNQIDAFTAFVSLAGMQDGYLWSVIGGNYQIPKRALEYSNATYHVAKVTKVTRREDGKYLMEYQPVEYTSFLERDLTQVNDMSTEFDVVIVAHALNLSKVQFINFPQSIYTDATKTSYHRTVATFIKGNPNAKLFGYSDKQYPLDYPLTVLTNAMKDSPVDFNSVSRNIPTTVTEKEAKKYYKPLSELPTQVYKVFSKDRLSVTELSKMFISIESIAIKDWMAYPHYNPPQECPPFVLDNEGLFYINGIEKAASAMEMSAIGAKNVSLLAKEYILREKGNVGLLFMTTVN